MECLEQASLGQARCVSLYSHLCMITYIEWYISGGKLADQVLLLITFAVAVLMVLFGGSFVAW
jgi:hypothetical protein